MKIKNRYTEIPFPPYAHLPGDTPHPKKAGGHSEQDSDPESFSITDQNWKEHQDYLYGVDLYNAEFFWEAHVWWEAVWKATPKGPERDFIQGLIKVAAAALKQRMGQDSIAKEHAVRGHELMSGKFLGAETSVFGVSRFWWNNVLIQNNAALELESE